MILATVTLSDIFLKHQLSIWLIYCIYLRRSKPFAVNVIASYEQLNKRRRTNVEDFIFDVKSSIITYQHANVVMAKHVNRPIQKVTHSRSQDKAYVCRYEVLVLLVFFLNRLNRSICRRKHRRFWKLNKYLCQIFIRYNFELLD